MPHFEFRSYHLMTTGVDAGTAFPVKVRRTLLLTGRPEPDGVQSTVWLTFEDPSKGTGTVRMPAPQTRHIYCRLPLAEFPVYYDILRTEKPLFFSYDVAAQNPALLRFFQVRSSTEPVGEGFTDGDAA